MHSSSGEVPPSTWSIQDRPDNVRVPQKDDRVDGAHPAQEGLGEDGHHPSHFSQALLRGRDLQVTHWLSPPGISELKDSRINQVMLSDGQRAGKT